MGDDSPASNSQQDSGNAKLCWLVRLGCLEKYCAKKKKEPAQQKQSRRLTNATLAIAFFTAAAVVIAGGTAYIAWKSDQTQRAINQAAVYFEKIILRADKTGDGNSVWGIGITVVNTGNTQVLQPKIRVACRDGKPTPTELPEWFGSKDNFSVIALCHKQPSGLQVCIINENEFNRIQKQTLGKYVIAEVIYADAFEKSLIHTTQFTHRINIDMNRQYSTSVVGPHNCADNCPKH